MFNKKKLFTLIEILIVSVLISIIFTIILSFYFKVLDIKVQTLARQDLMKSSYFLIEKLNILMKDYQIDYEEYFNRRIVGCDSDGGNSFSWDVGSNGYCDKFTTYGNTRLQSINVGTKLSDLSDKSWSLYYCSSTDSETSPNLVLQDSNVENGSGCWYVTPYGGENKTQPFGEYKKQFWDVQGDTDGTGGVVGDDDDVDIGDGPIAIADNTNVQELYLISKNGDKRLFIRRALVDSGDFNGDGNINQPREKRYTLQMLRLRGFDAGTNHNFCVNAATCSPVSSGVYDGVVDTWACDWRYGFKCSGPSLGGVYANYNLPNDINDGWVNVFPGNISVDYWNLQIYPSKNSQYAWNNNNYQINPYIRLNIRVRLYGGARYKKINPEALSGYVMDLQTTFNIKSFY